MFDDIFIYYLLNNKLINDKQAKEALDKKLQKARPAVVAVYDGLMTEEQARTIMKLQMANDMPFGFLAVREGFLTHEQSAAVSGRRQKEDMLIMQVLSDKDFMTMNDVMENLKLFKEHYNLDDDAYEGLVANKPEYYVRYIGGLKNEDVFAKFASVFIKIFARCVDTSLRIDKAYTADFIEGEYLTKVECSGDRGFILGITVEDEESALSIASRFLRHRQHEFNDDVEDTIKEFLNITAGLFTTAMEKDLGLDVDLFSPEMIIGGKVKGESKINIIDVYSFDCSARIFLTEI